MCNVLPGDLWFAFVSNTVTRMPVLWLCFFCSQMVSVNPVNMQAVWLQVTHSTLNLLHNTVQYFTKLLLIKWTKSRQSTGGELPGKNSDSHDPFLALVDLSGVSGFFFWLAFCHCRCLPLHLLSNFTNWLKQYNIASTQLSMKNISTNNEKDLGALFLFKSNKIIFISQQLSPQSTLYCGLQMLQY